MKPFNIEAALAGEPVITRSMRTVTQIHEFKCKGGNELAGVIDGALSTWKKDGSFLSKGKKSPYDLFMESKEINKWINIYRTQDGRFISGIHGTEAYALNYRNDSTYITTVPITFEI